MRYVKTKKLIPGMITTKSIYNKNGSLLLPSNKTLTNEDISAIRGTKLPGLCIYDEYSDYEQLNVIVDEDLRKNAVEKLINFNIDQVIFLSNQIVDSIMAVEDDLLFDLHELSIFDQNTYQHSIDVSMLATSCGIGLGLSNEELQNLAISGALHDIGKRAIPKDILNKHGKLSDKERHIMEKHPQIGYDMLYDNTNISDSVKTGVLTHHENWDGSGYPAGLKGTKIPLYGRILHVVDVYDALIRRRSYHEGYNHSETIEYLMANCGSMFDINVVRIFLKYTVVYPVGTKVHLSNGESARVIKNRNSSILRPVVMTKDKKTIDLAKDINYLNVVILE